MVTFVSIKLILPHMLMIIIFGMKIFHYLQTLSFHKSNTSIKLGLVIYTGNFHFQHLIRENLHYNT